MAPLLQVRDLTVDYPLPRAAFGRRRLHRAVDGVSFEIEARETLGLVGESGSGKSTIGRAILGLVRPTAGSITFDGVELTTAPPDVLRRLRPAMQVVFQNPYASLNPALTVGDAIGEAVRVHHGVRGRQLEETVATVMRQVGLDPALARRYPRAFSGGQRQRIAVARAIALRPRLLIADEPVSALDVSTRGQILNLLEDLGQELGLADLFIGHDLAVVRHISDRIAVLYHGQLVEEGPADLVADEPLHPYTQRLVAAVPVADPGAQASRRAARRTVDVLDGPAVGCPFAPRCPERMARCLDEDPAPRRVGVRTVRCHLYPVGDAAVPASPATVRRRRPVPVTVADDAEAAGRLVAALILDRVAAAGERDFLLACPAGRTPVSTYAALGDLAARRGADLSRVVVVMVDEYLVDGPGGPVPCSPTAHYSCRRHLTEHLLDGVNDRLPDDRRMPAERLLAPDPADPAAFDALLERAGGVDLYLLASGASDGHVAFNPPGTTLDAGTRVVTLPDSTRQDNLRTFPGFAGIDDVPRRGVTIGLGTITRARETVLVLLGADKAAAYGHVTATDRFDPSWPATVIHECPNASVVADRAAAGAAEGAR